jgi:hypothetical protein
MTADDMKNNVKEIGKQTQEKVGQVAEQAREQATEFFGYAQEKVVGSLNEQKERGVDELSSLVQAVRQTGQQLRNQQNEGMAHYIDQAAEKMDRMVHYVDSRNVSELIEEAESFSRRHPEAFLGGAFLLGIMAGRFMKSSRAPRMSDPLSRWEEPAASRSTTSTTV